MEVSTSKRTIDNMSKENLPYRTSAMSKAAQRFISKEVVATHNFIYYNSLLAFFS